MGRGHVCSTKSTRICNKAHGKPTLNKIVKSFDEFIDVAFNDDGSYNSKGDFPAMAGKNNKNCKWCPFKTSELCPKVERIRNI